MGYTTLREARGMVQKKRPFRGNNVEGEWDAGNTLYVVYSYRSTFPIYVYDTVSQRWFYNKDKYSRTTSRHQSACKPFADDPIYLPVGEMLELIYSGFMGLMELKAA